MFRVEIAIARPGAPEWPEVLAVAGEGARLWLAGVSGDGHQVYGLEWDDRVAGEFALGDIQDAWDLLYVQFV